MVLTQACSQHGAYLGLPGFQLRPELCLDNILASQLLINHQWLSQKLGADLAFSKAALGGALTRRAL
jgi:hypothetical protein